jgi:hypothetical protein
LQRDRILSAESFRGGFRPAGDDAVAILLDPFHDRRAAFVFATNPNGAEFDALLSNDGEEANVDWRAVWRVATARGPDGWSAEFEIPLLQGKRLNLQLGYSHDIPFPLPEGITVKLEGDRQSVIAISGADRQQVGQVASVIRSYRGPEPYKGKGIKYQGEIILRKEGKKK